MASRKGKPMTNTPKYRWAKRIIQAVVDRCDTQPDEREILLTQEEAEAHLYMLDLYDQGRIVIPFAPGQEEWTRAWKKDLLAERKARGLKPRLAFRYDK